MTEQTVHVDTKFVYNLYGGGGETSWSTVCGNGKENLLNGKFPSRLACTI